ncbi:unnamed protein product [Figwort mosaic virus]|uniref:Movement protein n=1 Tax=Figwort mosaic virus (strain DxS) TaxID=10650 RepID=MVP_FMVD|nr:unnamed protein product [Figwort mosaic virus]P09520.1 RecName: Full=Movement protein; Short=Mov; AltName: Full=Cell-to-cell transport protein [Figwort mosaic virus (STRAIN DXS)]CAA29523.1 unnamed protein product [Figwort mosaic virus]
MCSTRKTSVMDEKVIENEEIHFQENSNGFSADLTIHQDKLKQISKTGLNLEKEHIFNMPSSLTKAFKTAFKRKNEIFYCVSTKEMSVDIKDVSGQVYLPLITKQEIQQKLMKIDPSVRSKISMIHLGAVKILLTAQFRQGIDTSVKMALIDDRIVNRKDSLLGAARGNLAYGKFMFTVYPKFALSLQSKNLDKTLSFIHQFERKDLMKTGDKVFTVTYLIGYALTNSHHSIEYRKNSNIEIEEVFKDIGQIEESPFCDISPIDENWTMDIARNKKSIATGSSSRRNFRIDESLLENKDENLLRSMSTKIDTLGKKLSLIYDNE